MAKDSIFLGCQEETIPDLLLDGTDINDLFIIEKNAKTIFNGLVQALKINLESCPIYTKKDNSFFFHVIKNKLLIFM